MKVIEGTHYYGTFVGRKHTKKDRKKISDALKEIWKERKGDVS